MTRSPVWAILTFILLFLANIAAFAFFYFRDLSKAMVTQRLVEAANEARSVLNQSIDRDWDGRLDIDSVRQDVAPKLKRHPQVNAIVVLDGNGNVVYRHLLKNMKPGDVMPHTKFVPVDFRGDVALGPQRQVALEYDPTALDKEVTTLRQELYRKLGWSMAFSAFLLVVGLIYVVWAYKRSQKLQLEAQRADRLAYVGTLASGLAHEIRNPLNSMNMNIQLLQEELEDEGLGDAVDLQDMFQSTQREIQRLEKLVSSFLSYARPTQLQMRAHNPNELVSSILEFLALEIKQKEVVLTTELLESIGEVPLDENQLRQALLNVIQNALQILQPGQRLKIRTRVAGGDRVLIEIEDGGPGIAPQELENIFKVFYSTRRGGTGLGLPIAQRIAEAHGGGVKVESEVGKGTCVTFILPKTGPEST